jgi:hypothetical protein
MLKKGPAVIAATKKPAVNSGFFDLFSDRLLKGDALDMADFVAEPVFGREVSTILSYKGLLNQSKHAPEHQFLTTGERNGFAKTP